MRLLPFARAKALNFGVDVPEVACVCSGNRALLAEALTFRSSLHARTFA